MSELLPDLNEGEQRQQASMAGVPKRGFGGKISPWVKNSEFDTVKRITITRLARLCGTDTTAKPEFRDSEGCTYRLEFMDLDNGGAARKMENKFVSFFNDIKRCGVVKGGTYNVLRTHNGNIYKWEFTEAGVEL